MMLMLLFTSVLSHLATSHDNKLLPDRHQGSEFGAEMWQSPDAPEAADLSLQC